MTCFKVGPATGAERGGQKAALGTRCDVRDRPLSGETRAAEATVTGRQRARAVSASGAEEGARLTGADT